VKSKDDMDLDALLDELESESPSAALRRAVAEIPLRHPRSLRRWAFERLLPWQAVLAGAIACALGVVSGALSEPSGSDDGWDDVTTVAFASAFDEEQ
jgi:anti-sigma factor RsiW